MTVFLLQINSNTNYSNLPNAASVAELRKFSFLNNDATIDGLVNELPRYLAAADGTVIEEEEEKVQWWARHARTLPNWSAVVRKLLLVQPSSAHESFFHPSTGECT